jgi:hypothetical protein
MTRHLDPKTLFAASERHDSGGPLPARDRPLSCLDGSFVINPDGTVSKASSEQQQIAMAARAGRAEDIRAGVTREIDPARSVRPSTSIFRRRG